MLLSEKMEEFLMFNKRIDEKGQSLASLKGYFEFLAKYNNINKFNLLITCSGGSIGAVRTYLPELQEVITRYKLDITVINVEKVESAAVILFLGLSSKRYYLKNASFLIHSAFTNDQANEDIISFLNEYQRDIICETTKITIPTLQPYFQNKTDYILKGNDIEKYNIATPLDSLDFIKHKITEVPSKLPQNPFW